MFNLMKSNMNQIVLLEKIHGNAAALLTEQGFTDVREIGSALSDADLIDALQHASAVGIRSRTHMSATVLDALPNLRTIACFCIGTNQVDLHAACMRGIPVFNAPFSNTRSVAELVIAQAILLLRRIPEKNAMAHRGQWDKDAQGAYEVRNKVVGIIGYGNIGAQVGILAESVGMRVCYFDVDNKLPLGNAQSMSTLDALLRHADVVTLHVPGEAATENIINQERLACMKPSAVLINASRGNVVEIAALDVALRQKKIAGAAIDVFPTEPGNQHEEFISPLRGLDNVILTPHIGGSTEEAQENIGREVADKIARFLRAGTTRSAVNFPEIAYLPKHARHRILHIHRNEPGVIAQMNAAFAAEGLNIVAQQLQTQADIGYAMTDVDTPITDALMTQLRGSPATIRCDYL
ncbi:D-3-phosphoglycerate dehydrogenase [Betaproteobacteria bacterium MOLA814]|jgi:D-3-phosphoglycerate dehydrogenase|nr:D-3-phosphoglycerate dehydrogenase [Betaproteobacteria bacterium MOLA814]